LGPTSLAEAGGQNLHGPHFFLDAVPDRLHHKVGGHGYGREIDVAFDILQTGVCFLAVDIGNVGVYRIKPLMVLAVSQYQVGSSAEFCRITGRANDGDGTGLKNGLPILCSHVHVSLNVV
jgi:hypothetical protein